MGGCWLETSSTTCRFISRSSRESVGRPPMEAQLRGRTGKLPGCAICNPVTIRFHDERRCAGNSTVQPYASHQSSDTRVATTAVFGVRCITIEQHYRGKIARRTVERYGSEDECLARLLGEAEFAPVTREEVLLSPFVDGVKCSRSYTALYPAPWLAARARSAVPRSLSASSSAGKGLLK
jgi:hypothetical protein